MARTPVGDVLRRRSERIARRFHDAIAPPLLLARDLTAVVGLNAHGGGALEPLPFREEGRALVWRKPNADDTSLWVRAGDPAYRDAFCTFLEHVYGAGAIDLTHFDDYDVDHLFNRANALADDFLRVEGIASSINRSHGAGFERLNTHSTIAVAQRHRKEQRLMTFVSVLKVAGLKAPRSTTDTARLQPIYAFLLPNGWPRAVVDDAIADLLGKARF